MGLCEGGIIPAPRAWNVAGKQAEPKRAPKGHFLVCNESINSFSAAVVEVPHE